MAPNGFESKFISFDELPTLATRLRKEGKKIITTNGCFDLLHLGHLYYLEQAKKLGDVLICGVNSDVSVKELKKGPDRPIQGEKTRALQLAAVESVSFVTIFSESTPINFIKSVQPSIHVKGGDYLGKELPEKEVVEAFGGSLKLIQVVKGHSTTALIERIKG